MQDKDKEFDVIVIGGGASGMMAAGRAGERGFRVLLVEKNERLGEKLNITGGGRCNITNAIFDHREFLKIYGEAQDFLFSPFSQFGVKDTFTFFERLGLPLVTEARTRVFPHTQKAEDVTKTLARYLKKNGVVIKAGVAVTKILTEEKQIVGVQCGKDKFYAKNLILATGGLSHPETGSTGDGFKWLSDLGHTVRKPSPDVVPLEVKEKWVKDLSGVSLSFMKITFYLTENHLDATRPSKKAFAKTGKILFTHFGLSGPLILNSAREVKKLLMEGKVTATIDAFPDTDLGTLDKQIIKIFDANKNKELKTTFKEKIAPAGTGEAILPLLSFNTSFKVHSVTVEQRKEIVHLLKALPLTVTGLMGFDRSVVSDGGVLLSEIDTRTMRSKIHPNLFVLGDLLDINRQSGGYSLQLCWTTGFVAAEHLL
ncbi:MAG: NAD(P)/FAD-dependent oxidoreductase [Candidatus Vogelbacteria bacterium]|nr:NAD(P)/FAD-dependent oxidoreductase [Candidatus Vogelbacteria bacterium]